MLASGYEVGNAHRVGTQGGIRTHLVAFSPKLRDAVWENILHFITHTMVVLGTTITMPVGSWNPPQKGLTIRTISFILLLPEYPRE